MQGKVNTGALYNSMKVFVGANKSAMYMNMTPKVDYWEYVDKGVQGASKNIFRKQSESPFKFGSGRGKPGLRSAIDRWTVQKNISGTRDEKGRFVPRQSIVFAISRAIWHRGLKPTLFISGTWKRLRVKALKILNDAVTKDIAEVIKQSLQTNPNLEVE